MNSLQLLGTLVRDPEMRYLPNGTAIASFTVAHNRRWKDQQGQKKEDVTFIDVTAFGKTGETIGQYFKKGSRILVVGRLKTDSWQDKQTQQKRSKLTVVLEEFHFIDRAQEAQEDAPPRQTMAKRVQETAAAEEDPDSIPF